MRAITSQRPVAGSASTRSQFVQNQQKTRSAAFNLSKKVVFTVRAEQNKATESMDQVPAGCSRYTVSLGKPLGLVLEERKATGSIVVAEIVPGGNAEKSGVISIGDQLIATSGYTRTTEQMYGDIAVRGGEQIIRLQVRGESFDTVLAAISSHPGNFKCKLEFQQCDEVPETD
jgi:C-terminal processing protease CtpA/Prc